MTSSARWQPPVEPGADGLLMLPHLQGAMAPEKAADLPSDVLMGLALQDARAHVVRALMEGICSVVRRNVEAFPQRLVFERNRSGHSAVDHAAPCGNRSRPTSTVSPW